LRDEENQQENTRSRAQKQKKNHWLERGEYWEPKRREECDATWKSKEVAAVGVPKEDRTWGRRMCVSPSPSWTGEEEIRGRTHLHKKRDTGNQRPEEEARQRTSSCNPSKDSCNVLREGGGPENVATGGAVALTWSTNEKGSWPM